MLEVENELDKFLEDDLWDQGAIDERRKKDGK
jgi:hypothetical protein